ncbi:TPA: NADH:ubiquinone oxidoreductase [Candidatus Bipolaricaulota bacterium]|nr:NADH:ubiquinone oxidoreductase [Candidatus Bipolaricaulota bacterium]
MVLLTHAPILIIGLPLLGAFALPLVARAGERARNWFAISILILTSALAFSLSAIIFREGTRVYVLGGEGVGVTLPSGYLFPIRIILEIDGIGAFMVSIVGLIALLGGVYSLAFMGRHSGLEKYWSLFLLLTAGMFGLVETGDAFNFFVFLEITSVAACGLVAFRAGRAEAVEAGFKTLSLYIIAGLFVLLGVGILYGQYGALNFAYLATKLEWALPEMIALALFLIALTLKAGAVPMHMWVVDAYPAAPAPATIALVANSLCSLYALYRICFTLYGAQLGPAMVGWIVIILGTLSILIGTSMALIQTDLKRLIAYSGIAQVGYMFLGVGVGLAVLGTPALNSYGLTAMKGGIFHLFNYALYEGLLFLGAGAIFYRTGTRDLGTLGGLGHRMKWTALFFLIGGAAIAGLPPLNGFASKLIIYESVFKFSPILSVIAMLASILTLAIYTRAFQGAFLGRELESYREIREVPRSMMVAMGCLAVLVVLFGLFPNLVVKYIVDPAAQALIDQAGYVEAIMGLGVGVK